MDVSFSCTDSGGSGINTNTVAGATKTASGADQSVTNFGSCTDNAGNTADSATFGNINIDKVAPTVGIATANKLNADNTSAGAYTFGEWTNKDVKVSWSCTDAASGPVNASNDQTFTASGSVTPSCEDEAGNTASSGSAFEVKIDKVARPSTPPVPRLPMPTAGTTRMSQ